MMLLILGMACTCGAVFFALAPSRARRAERRNAAAAGVVSPPAEPPAAASAEAADGAEAAAETLDAEPLPGHEAQPEANAERGLDRAQVLRQLHAVALGAALLEPRKKWSDELEAAVAAAVERSATDARYALRRPMLLPQLLKAVNDSETSRRELSAIIAQDPALVGSLLKLANSAFYRVGTRPIESVDRAVATLGTEGIRSLVAAALMQPVFRVRAGQFANFPTVAWEHTFRASAGAEAHAAFVERTDRFAAQLLGLLLGLGEIVVFRIVLDRHARGGSKVEPAAMAKALEAHAARAATLIAAEWQLSDRIIEALDCEADDLREPTPLGRSLRFGRIVGALAVLHAHGVVDDALARASLPQDGAPHVDRIWTRLCTALAADSGDAKSGPARRSAPAAAAR